MSRVLLVILLSVISAGNLSAQTRERTEERGALASAASAELRRLDAQQGVRIERRRNDSVLNGALIGAAVGVASGLLVCRSMEPWEVCNDPGPLLRVGALGAAIGIGIDALIRKREVTYGSSGSTELQVAPLVGRGTKGMQLGLRF